MRMDGWKVRESCSGEGFGNCCGTREADLTGGGHGVRMEPVAGPLRAVLDGPIKKKRKERLGRLQAKYSFVHVVLVLS